MEMSCPLLVICHTVRDWKNRLQAPGPTRVTAVLPRFAAVNIVPIVAPSQDCFTDWVK